MVVQHDMRGHEGVWWHTHRRVIDRALVAVGIFGVVLAIVIALWSRL